MKKNYVFVLAAIAFVLFSNTIQAQDQSKKTDEERTIVIRKKSGPVTVITTDSVSSITINGEQIDPDDIASINVIPGIIKGYKSPDIWPVRSSKAFLGVATKESEQGAEIMEVSKGSPAQKAGFEKGDIITKVGETKINNPQELASAIQSHKPGDKVKITFLRSKKSKTVNVELAKEENAYSFMGDAWMENGFGNLGTSPRSFGYNFTAPKVVFGKLVNSPSIGLQVQDTEDESGVTVLKVEPNSAGEKAGVKAGDLITTVNGIHIQDVDSIRKAMRSAKDNHYDLGIKREGNSMIIQVKIPKKLQKAEL